MLQWLHTYVSSVCFKCFICFHIYVANVSSRCFKSRSSVACRRLPAIAGVPPGSRVGPTDAFAVHICRWGRWARVLVLSCGRGVGCGSTLRTLDGHGGTVLSCGARDGRDHGFRMLALVGNRIERVGCDASTGARELRPDVGLGPDVRMLASPYL
jgi:hypothetical protein